MRIYLKNSPTKFHPDPFWNDGFFEERRPNKKNKVSSNMGHVISVWSKNSDSLHSPDWDLASMRYAIRRSTGAML